MQVYILLYMNLMSVNGIQLLYKVQLFSVGIFFEKAEATSFPTWSVISTSMKNNSYVARAYWGVSILFVLGQQHAGRINGGTLMNIVSDNFFSTALKLKNDIF